MSPQETGRVPYAPDFTPATLGKELGPDAVLPFLLEAADRSDSKTELSGLIQERTLSHIARLADRRDMASHVVQGLQNYGLVSVDDGTPLLTEVGRRLLVASDSDRDLLFARHILVACHGMAVVEEVQRGQFGIGGAPSLQDLAEIFDQSATGKSVSSMRAWLERGGIFEPGRYLVNSERLQQVLGASVAPLLGLDPVELEFAIAARLVARQLRAEWVSVVEVEKAMRSRRPDLPFKSKARSSFARKMAAKGVVEVDTGPGAGGTRLRVRLLAEAEEYSDQHLEALVNQTRSGIALAELSPLSEVLEGLEVDDINVSARAAEMLAIHVIISLGLRVEAWRARAPEAEIDVLAQRTACLGYQRWAVQVKHTKGSISVDRINREVGAAMGSGVTHILFVVPKSGLSASARSEIVARCALTQLHILYLDRASLERGLSPDNIAAVLRRQSHDLAAAKRLEADRRSGLRA